MASKDWVILDQLSANPKPSVTDSYLQLASDYIVTNAAAVKRLHELDASLSRNIVEDDPDVLAEAFAGLSQIERQSVFTFRLYCAINADSHSTIADYFARSPHSDWVSQSLLYPLIFHAINLPSDDSLNHLLDQIFPHLRKNKSEHNVVSLLLRDDIARNAGLALRCYVGLLCHPYDALLLLISHYEHVFSDGGEIQQAHRDILSRLNSVVYLPRLASLVDQLNGGQLTYQTNPIDLPISRYLNLGSSGAHFLEAYVAAPGNDYLPAIPSTGLYGSLSNLRWSKYPQVKDFNEAVLHARRYAFCEAGRLLSVLLSSIYMVERASPVDERTGLLRQVAYFGAVSPFTLCSPRGASSLDRGMFSNIPRLEERAANDIVPSVSGQNSRWWIKLLHWKLRDAERSTKVAEWLKVVRTNVRLSGNSRFLSGIDWSWVDAVIRQLRIKPFEGNVDGVYVLLIRQMEQAQREPNTLKLALAPLVPKKAGLAELVRWLGQIYGADTIAFVRFFLTPAMILKMKLENNYTAALSERLLAIDWAVSEFGYNDDILTQDQYQREQRSLITSLTFLAVGAAQFELSWDALAGDALSNSDDEFATFQAFNKTYNQLSLLSGGKKETPVLFGNRQVRRYTFKNRDWPLAMVIFQIVNTFLSHPSSGIESILAIRIRHDNLRREIALIIADVKKTRLRKISPDEQKVAIALVEGPLLLRLQQWIDQYMHTPKHADDEGAFEFTPSQEQMDVFISGIHEGVTHQQIVRDTIDWLRGTLETHLAYVREQLMPELKAALTDEFSRVDPLSKTWTLQAISVLREAVLRKVDELTEWFATPSKPRDSGLSFLEMRDAVEGRFASEITSGALVTAFFAPALSGEQIHAENIRRVFDLWSELTTNALKYSNRSPANLRISELDVDGMKGLRFSSLSNGAEAGPPQFFEAEPNVADEAAFERGKSGFRKVAALAAGIARQKVTVVVHSRTNSFHVWVPFRPVA
ncbi:hypothetical protein RFM99_20010 [Mesorhizobium sp. VK4C]|uniref:hypothetical protein n=1 Tax=Mesorhizobium captivum TaxID=3072319 RepID=UPI002A24399E|nr:hypothetical protein [Mesorhizobium sp. VK4C]MDX8500692.1 hypothetical protein [Mesorhizobium sp. VK4C]